MKKKFWVIGIGALILIAVIFIAIGFYLGPLAKIAIETIGPKVTSVAVSVDAVDISLLTGSAQIKALVVADPQGFSSPQAISVGTIAVSIDPMSVMSQKILIHSIKIESPEITYESGLGGNNLSQLAKNANNANNSPQSADTASKTSSDNKPAPKIEVDDLLITGAKVHVILKGLVSKVVPLPDIHLTDLGKDSNGLTAAALAQAVLSAITSDTVTAVTGSVANIAQDVSGIGGSTINKLTSTISGLLGK